MKIERNSDGKLPLNKTIKLSYNDNSCLNSGLKKDDNYYLQVRLKDYKSIKKKVIKHNHDNLSDFFVCFFSWWMN